MDDAIRQEYQDQIRDLRLPRYEQIPNVGLYLEQTAKYISEYLAPLGDMALTGSMISNYVKKGLLASPVKKQYSREQICYLFFIAVAKTVMSMEDIRLMIRLQKEQYTPQKAYDYFCTELENALHYIFALKPEMETIGQGHTVAKDLLRTTIIAVAHKVYLDKAFASIRQTMAPPALPDKPCK